MILHDVTAVLDEASARRYRAQAVRAALYAVGEGLAFGLTLPVLAALLDGDTARAGWWLVPLAAVAAVTLLLHDRQTVAGLRGTFQAINTLHRRIAAHLAALPVEWFRAGGAGSLNRLVWPGAVHPTKDVLLNLAPLLRGVLAPAAVLIVAAFVDWRPALVMLVALPLLWLTYRATAGVIERTERADHRAHAEAAARVLEFAGAQPTLRASRRAGLGMRLLEGALAEQEAAARTRVGREMLARAGFGTAVSVAVAALIAVLGLLLLLDERGSVLLIALLALVPRFAEPLRTVADLARTLRTARTQAARAADLLATPPLPAPDPPRPRPDGRAITFSGVRYRYPGAPGHAVDGVDLDVPEGTTTALVGPSGAGKSTLLRLAARFTDPQEGAVTVGGTDVRDLDPGDLYGIVGMVLQEVVLLEGTIRENVLLNRPGATPDELDRAAALAGVDEIVARLPGGWDTRVGARGTSLSGGERQRVSLARVALQDPPVVLLDEVTAALDPVNERVVGRWIDAMSGRRTLLVVAHRLHTIVRADTIAVVEDGRVTERGTHAGLLAAGGSYARIRRARERAEGWRLDHGRVL